MGQWLAIADSGMATGVFMLNPLPGLVRKRERQSRGSRRAARERQRGRAGGNRRRFAIRGGRLRRNRFAGESRRRSGRHYRFLKRQRRARWTPGGERKVAGRRHASREMKSRRKWRCRR